MKTQVIPDIHHRWVKVEQQIQQENADQVILLGDYFDQYNDNEQDAAQTAHWLNQSLQDPKRIHLIGNHDLWYFWSRLQRPCPGNSAMKRAVILKEIDYKNWSKLRLIFIQDNIIFSHAGVRPKLFAHPVYGLNKAWLEQVCDRAMNTPFHPIFDADRMRGGSASQAGILWQDFRNMVFAGDWNQIVGHTPDNEVRIAYRPNKKDATNVNIGLDTNSRYYGIIEDGKFFVVNSNKHRKFLVDLPTKIT